MTEKDKIFMQVILAIEAQRGDWWDTIWDTIVVNALDKLEDDIREIAKSHGVSIPEPS